MQPPSAPKYAHKLPPLRDAAAKLAPGFSAGRSTPSKPDIATLLERFNETPAELSGGSTAFAANAPAAPARGVAPARHDGTRRRQGPVAASAAPPAPESRLTFGSVVSALAGVALVPISFLFFLWWQNPPQDEGPSEVVTVASAPTANAVEPRAQTMTAPKIARAAPDGIEPEAAAGPSVEPPQVATVDDPDIAYSLAPAATVDAPEIAPSPAPVAAVEEPESAPAAEIAQAEVTGSIADPAPAPQRKPVLPAAKAEVRVNTVKVVTIKPPAETLPHDGAYALGSAADEPDANVEWMETKTAVDMHAKAQQTSETVKIADGGMKLRVAGRDKNWVQVTDPATSTTGWIYNRFLTPAEPPAQ